MRHRGTITSWKDERGFGFITPSDGGEQAFVHIKSFSNRRRRPSGGEAVAYELALDQNGRPQAVNVDFIEDRQPSASSPTVRVGSLAAASVYVGIFLGMVATMVLAGKLSFTVLVLYLAASVVTFFAYGLDKSAAQKRQWRIREDSLHLLALVGGWPGGFVAQQIFRHKTRKRSFQVIFWGTVLLNLAMLCWLLSPWSLVIFAQSGAKP